jgi:hypothetical protein
MMNYNNHLGLRLVHFNMSCRKCKLEVSDMKYIHHRPKNITRTFPNMPYLNQRASISKTTTMISTCIIRFLRLFSSGAMIASHGGLQKNKFRTSITICHKKNSVHKSLVSIEVFASDSIAFKLAL